MALGGGGNIKVVVRVRPFNSRGTFLSLYNLDTEQLDTDPVTM
jgi:hypothetical protein